MHEELGGVIGIPKAGETFYELRTLISLEGGRNTVGTVSHVFLLEMLWISNNGRFYYSSLKNMGSITKISAVDNY